MTTLSLRIARPKRRLVAACVAPALVAWDAAFARPTAPPDTGRLFLWEIESDTPGADGAAHRVGSEGLPALLSKRGLRVRQVSKTP